MSSNGSSKEKGKDASGSKRTRSTGTTPGLGSADGATASESKSASSKKKDAPKKDAKDAKSEDAKDDQTPKKDAKSEDAKDDQKPKKSPVATKTLLGVGDPAAKTPPSPPVRQRKSPPTKTAAKETKAKAKATEERSSSPGASKASDDDKPSRPGKKKSLRKAPPPPRRAGKGSLPPPPPKRRASAPPPKLPPPPKRPADAPARPSPTPDPPPVEPKPEPTPQPAPVAPKPMPAPPPPEPEPEDPALAEDARKALIETCEAELKTKPDKVKSARLHFEIARAEDDEQRALTHYRQAVALVADHLPAIRGARKLELKRKDINAAVRWFDAEIELTNDGPRAALLHYAKGRTLEDLGDDTKAARESYAQAAALDGSNPTVLKALQHAELGAQQWANLERAREQEANAGGEDKIHRAALLVGRARLLETRLNDAESATELYEAALDLDPRASGALPALKRLLHAQKRWGELCEVLEREAKQSSDLDVRTMAHFQISRIHSEQLGNRSEAIEALVRARRTSPEDRLVLEELVKLYEPSDDTAGLARTLEHLVETLADDRDRLAVLQRIAELYDLRHGDDEKAARWYEAVLELEPTFTAAIHALDALYAAQDQWDKLIAMRTAEAAACTEPLRRAQVHGRIADIYERQLEQAERATEHYEQALSFAPEHEPSFKALTRLYTQAGRYRELIELYGRAIDRAKDEDVVIAYLFKIGALYEDPLRSPGLAMPSYRRVLERRPKHLGAIHALQRAADVSGHHADFVEALEREAELVRDPRRILALLLQAGDVLADRLRDRESALDRYRRVLELDSTYVPALVSLGRLYHKMGRWKDLLAVHERELEAEPQDAAKVRLLIRMADLAQHKLGDDDRAVAWYRQAVDLDPTHQQALHELQLLLRRKQAWAALATVIETELGGLRAPDAMARAGYRLGEVYDAHLRKPALAVKAYERALEASPGYRPAAEALTRVHSAMRSWKQLATGLHAEASAADHKQHAVDALLRALEVHAELLDQPDEAIACGRAILELDEQNLAALIALEGLYHQTSAWEDLVQIYTMQARVLQEKPSRVAALEALARLLTRRLPDQDDELRKTYGAILSADSANLLALEGLEQMALAQQDPDLLADVDSRSTKAESDPALVAAHFTRLGESLEAGSTAAAMAAYRSALERGPDNLAAIRGLARVADKRGDTAAAVEAARREAEWTRDVQRAADLLVRSAMLRVQQLSDRDGAVQDALDALDRCPDHAGAAYRLMELLLWTNQIDRLVEALSAAAHGTSNKRRRAQLWQTVANLYADHQDNVPAGITALKRALESQPNDVGTLMRLAELYGRDTQWDQASSLLERVVELKPDEEQRVDAHVQLARIFTQHRKDRQLALMNLDAVLELNTDHRDALTMLMELRASEGKLAEARTAAERLVDTSKGPGERSWALLHLGRIEHGAGNHHAAGEAWRGGVALGGPQCDAAQEYRQHIADDEPWELYVDALTEHLHGVEAGELEDADLAATYLEIARTQQDKLSLLVEGFETLRSGLRSCGDHPALGLELAEALGRAGRHPEAIAEFQRLVYRDPTHATAWRGLARTLQEYGRPSEASAAAAPLLVLGAATEVERNLAMQRKARPGWVRPSSCTAATLQSISAANLADESLLSALLTTMIEGLGKLHPPQFERYGLTSRDKVSERSEHPLRATCDRLAHIFAVERYDLYVYHPRYGNDVAIELTQPVSLLVPAFLPELGEAQQVFMLARAFGPMTRGLHPALRLTVEELHQVVIAGARSGSPTFGAGWYDEHHIEGLHKRLIKALPRRNRRALEESAAHYTAGPEVDVATWVKTVDRTRTRAAAIVSGDLPACVDVLRQSDQALAALEGPAVVSGSELVADLFRFWASEPAMEFRRLIGAV